MTKPHRPALLHGYVAVILAAACWGTSGIFIKLIMTSSGMGASSLAFWRDLATFLLFGCACILSRPRRMRIPKSDWPWLAGMGICLGLFHVGWNMGIMLNGAAITTVQQAAMPAIVIVIARILWQEPLTLPKLAALTLIMGGTVLVSGVLSSDRPDVTGLSIAAGLSVPVLYAGFSLFGKKLRGQYASEVVLMYAFGIGALVLLPFGFYQITAVSLSTPVWLWFAGLILLSTGGGFFAYTYSLGALPAGIVGILAMSEILFVSLYAWYLLGESLSGLELWGAGLVVGGVCLLFVRYRWWNRRAAGASD